MGLISAPASNEDARLDYNEPSVFEGCPTQNEADRPLKIAVAEPGDLS